MVVSGLAQSAAAVLTLGREDFTVAQNGVSEILYSSRDEGQLHEIQTTPAVKDAVGVLLETQRIKPDNPLLIEMASRRPS
jgi:hypothetical protein